MSQRPQTNAEPLVQALSNVFPSFRSLPVGQRQLLVTDLDALLAELGWRTSPYEAAVELRRRIGGDANLKSYVACLEAGAAARARRARP